MTRRRYAQFCPLAKALDLIGERWTLLVVRELLNGPKRYTDIREGLPGMATDLLATRLRELQQAGLIERHEVPKPTPATVYQLTARGEGLRPVIQELAAWGRPLLLEPAEDFLPPSALSLGLQAAFQPKAAKGINETYNLQVDQEKVTIRVRNGVLRLEPGTAAAAVVSVVTDRQGFMDLARGHTSPRVRTEGDASALPRLLRIFSLNP